MRISSDGNTYVTVVNRVSSWGISDLFLDLLRDLLEEFGLDGQIFSP